jgi:exosortase A
VKVEPEWGAAMATARPAPDSPGNRALAIGLVLSALVWLLAYYGDTVLAMVAIWWSSETFAHGFLIVPISAWLVWQRRHVVSALPVRPAYVALPLLALAGFGWFFAGLAGVGVVQQYAVVMMIPLTVLVVTGRQVARALAFPLFFLLFAVPFGEFLEGMLMEHTADFAAAALRLTGIPVYREGQFLTLPTGNWSVVEACSGLRYLIASLTVGVLYAYLTYRSLPRRLAFVAASIVMPIVANWLRAYMIIMIGHLSGMKYAVGVDHLIYGWVFFGVVMALLFWVGSFWREDLDERAPQAAPVAPANREPRPLGAMAGAALAGALVAAAWPVAAEWLENARSPELSVLEAPAAAAGWKPVSGALTLWRPRFQDARTVVEQGYAKDATRAAIHIRYYAKQRPGAQLISSQNALVWSDNKEWKNTGEAHQSLALGNEVVPAIEARLKSSSGYLLVWRWYWIDGQYVVNPYWAKILQAKSVLFGHGDDGAAIILYAPYESQPDSARRALQDLAAAMLPAISTSLEHARQARNAR